MGEQATPLFPRGIEGGNNLRLRERLHFLVQFARHPRTVGAIAPSSRQLALAMVRDMDLQNARHVVELGAGTGVFTSVIAECLPASACLTALEINPELAASLRRSFDGAVRIVCGSAADMCRHLDRDVTGGVDAVISGLPWAVFSTERQLTTLLEVYRALRPGGRFATFAYAHAAWLPPGRNFRRMLRSLFASTEISPIVWRNAPPAFIYRCRK